MKMNAISIVFVMAGVTGALAQTPVDPERLAEFVATLEANDCSFPASWDGTKFLRDAGFSGAEITQLRRELVGSGQGVVQDNVFTLRSANCG
jgi:hypothetical protein